MKMRYLTRTAGIMFAYFCDSTTRFLAFFFTPLHMFMHYCFGGEGWRERRERGIKDVIEVGAHITPALTWVSLTITIMVFWSEILESYIFFEDHEKVANGSMILLGITILPIIIWWINNRDFIMDVKNNLRLGEKKKKIYVTASLLFFLLQLAMPFVMLWF